MKKLAIIIIATLSAAPAYAGCNTFGSTTRCYDYQTGNSYTTRRDSFGNSRTQGWNSNTGSMWNQRTSGATGRTSGYDSNGGFWSCDRRGNCF
jgi:hypothetical protein